MKSDLRAVGHLEFDQFSFKILTAIVVRPKSLQLNHFCKHCYKKRFVSILSGLSRQFHCITVMYLHWKLGWLLAIMDLRYLPYVALRSHKKANISNWQISLNVSHFPRYWHNFGWLPDQTVAVLGNFQVWMRVTVWIWSGLSCKTEAYSHWNFPE